MYLALICFPSFQEYAIERLESYFQLKNEILNTTVILTATETGVKRKIQELDSWINPPLILMQWNWWHFYDEILLMKRLWYDDQSIAWSEEVGYRKKCQLVLWLTVLSAVEQCQQLLHHHEPQHLAKEFTYKSLIKRTCT